MSADKKFTKLSKAAGEHGPSRTSDRPFDGKASRAGGYCTRYSVLLIEILDPTTGPEMTSCVLIVVYYGLPPWSSGYNIHPLSRNLGVRVSTRVHFSSDFRNGKHKHVSTKSSTIG